MYMATCVEQRLDREIAAMPAGRRLTVLRMRGCAPSRRRDAAALYRRIKAGRPEHLPGRTGAR